MKTRNAPIIARELTKNQVFQIREEYIVQWKWRSRRHDEYNQGKQKKVKQEETRFFLSTQKKRNERERERRGRKMGKRKRR